ncbi:zinc finger HIT domain-containing protein 2-like isoform X2 [Ostrea edulis]|uniref:zinc finger HIT domain-containing protein 2-like isoform X2 n=1 Tax=Ostrea edulis TaxID=37623 RepID=UPI002094A5FA|nr:zinc finger HIT domain-containing protein 2-like isoform X2 [Ostrea edulis]
MMEQSSACEICQKDQAKYTCPRCNTRYCGLSCYRDKSHSECSEAFYKTCCMEALGNRDVSSEEKQKMLEMLDRLEKEEAENSDEMEEELLDRLTGLNLDTDSELIWSRLTEKEQAQFNRMAEDGRLGNLVEVWTPWWDVKKEKISEVDGLKANHAPKVTPKIPDISKLLTKSKPSADIKNNVVNVLYAYVFVCRLYNGTHWDCPQESALKLVKTSDVMAKHSVCSSPSEAVQLCMTNRECQQSQNFLIGLVSDVIKVLQGPSGGADLDFVLAALSDVLQLLKKSHSQYKRDVKLYQASSSDFMEEKQLLFLSMKKVEFYLGWCQRCGIVLLSVLPELKLEHSRLLEELKVTNEVRESIEKNLDELRPPKPGSQLIEELT